MITFTRHEVIVQQLVNKMNRTKSSLGLICKIITFTIFPSSTNDPKIHLFH